MCLCISKADPRLKKSFKGYGPRWLGHLRTYGSSPNLLTIKIMHESHDLDVIKRWKKYYYECWNVLNNPKFIHSHNKKTFPMNAGPNNYLYGRSIVKERKLRWYNDGYSKSILVTENTQPKGYVLGRIINHRKKPSGVGRLNISRANSKGVIAPSGQKFRSLTAAAKAFGVDRCTINYYIKTGNGWRYA
jgi:hypothetical protein